MSTCASNTSQGFEKWGTNASMARGISLPGWKRSKLPRWRFHPDDECMALNGSRTEPSSCHIFFSTYFIVQASAPCFRCRKPWVEIAANNSHGKSMGNKGRSMIENIDVYSVSYRVLGKYMSILISFLTLMVHLWNLNVNSKSLLFPNAAGWNQLLMHPW
jgi:hypothetical protein